MCRFALKKKKTSKSLHGHFRRNRSRVELRDRCNHRNAISISFDNVSLSMKAKNCAASSELLFCLFSRCCRFSGCVEIGSNVTIILDMRRFCLENHFCRSYITNTYCNIVCFVLRPSFMCVMFFWRPLYGVKEVVHWFLVPLATTRFTMVNLIVI